MSEFQLVKNFLNFHEIKFAEGNRNGHPYIMTLKDYFEFIFYSNGKLMQLETAPSATVDLCNVAISEPSGGS